MPLILVVDLATAFAALGLTLWLRYGGDDFYLSIRAHLFPFSIIIGLFLLIFYIFNLYSFRFNKNITDFTNSFIKSLTVSFALAILTFYIFGDFFKLTPKTNLVIFTGIFGAVDFYLRILIKRYFVRQQINRKIVMVGDKNDPLAEELAKNQNIGFDIVQHQNNLNLNEVIALKPDVVVINQIAEKEFEETYAILKAGTSVYTINSFYEEIFQKVPTDRLGRENILDYLSKNRTVLNFIKRMMDIALALILLLILTPLFVIVAILIKLTSQGPVLFKHQRVSMNDTEFTMYKFRSMREDAEKDGAVWTENNRTDPRITPIGRFLRQTHLDEIPQLINILRGDISFVGPRPERPEFTEKLAGDMPYYNLRHAVKAGLTGWAQVNYKYGSSVLDAREKLKYDFYYIKNQTIFFDFLIILKTLAKIFTH